MGMFRSLGSLQVQIIMVCGATPLLFIPNPYIRSLIILAFVLLIYAWEKRLNMLVPASPGVMFWLGAILSYIVGGVGLATLEGSWDGFGLRYLNDALLYLGIGFSAYLLGSWLAGVLITPQAFRPLFRDFQFQGWKLVILCVAFIAPILLVSGSRTAGSLYANLVTGAIQSIEVLPLILLALYLFSGRAKWWLVLLLFVAAFAVAIDGMIIGYGRNKLMYAILALCTLWWALHQWHGLRFSSRTKLVLALMPIFLFSYFGVSSAYRDLVGFDREVAQEQGAELYRESLHSVHEAGFFRDTMTKLMSRLTQAHGLELLGRATSVAFDKHGWTEEDVKSLVFSYVPRYFFPEKNKGLGRDIMEYYGFTVWNNIPPTLLADSYRRSGLVGVSLVYFLMGFVATWMVIWLNKRWGSVGPLLAVFLALSSIKLVSVDAVSLFQFYFYRIPSSGFVIVVILILTGIVSRSALFGRKRPLRSAQARQKIGGGQHGRTWG